MKYNNIENIAIILAEFDNDVIEENVNGNYIRYRLGCGLLVKSYKDEKNIFVQGKIGLSKKLKNFLLERETPNAIDLEKSEEIITNFVSLEKEPKVEILEFPQLPTDKEPQNSSFKYTRHENEKIDNGDKEYTPNQDSEIVIALVGAVGTDLSAIISVIKERLKIFKYKTNEIEISNSIISELKKIDSETNFKRINNLMTEGNNIRDETGDNSILAKLASAKINAMREKNEKEELLPMRRNAFIIRSLKHPEEVAALRTIYQNGFFLIGVHASSEIRYDYLNRHKGISPEDVEFLFKRDVDEIEKHGQHTRDTYHLSDFFVDFGENRQKFDKDVWRIIDLIFGKPFVTPTFDEFAMFMAFSASLRSADLSRQVGAVVTRNHAIVSTGANDVPQYGSGLYWPDYYNGNEIHDVVGGRDYVRKGDTNVIEKNDIIADILLKIDPVDQPRIREILANSKLKNITEYGRVVHAEMEALLSCARSHIATAGADIYCTTFPCHNCAKHIIAAGIKKVVYVEPYPKSKAQDFHSDAITLTDENERLKFQPFVGVGPRSFFNLFSVNLGSGYEISRKDKQGKPIEWHEETARVRMQMLPTSYIERESITTSTIHPILEKIK